MNNLCEILAKLTGYEQPSYESKTNAVGKGKKAARKYNQMRLAESRLKQARIAASKPIQVV
jgi:hypothetical protein